MRYGVVLICVSLICTANVYVKADGPPAGEKSASTKPAATSKPAAAKPATAKEWRVETDIAYVEGGDKAQVLDLYLPENKPGTPLPVVLWIHGGGWKAGSKSGGPFMYLMKHGYAVASVEYRFSKVARFPAQIQDCQAAVRWVRANSGKYNLDSAHVGVWGASAGGHLAALVGTTGGKKEFAPIGGNEKQSDKVLAVVDFYGPANFNTLKEHAQADPNSIRKFTIPGDNASNLIGVNLGEDKAKEAAASPVHYVGKDSPAFLILHGDEDHLVPMAQSVELYETLKKAGVEATFQKMPGSGHGSAKFAAAEAQGLILAFFDKHLKGKDVKVEALPEEVMRLKPAPVKAPDNKTTAPPVEEM